MQMIVENSDARSGISVVEENMLAFNSLIV